MYSFEAVIFDLGAVILNIDYGATELALRRLLGPRGDLVYQSTRQSSVFDDLETGRIGAAAFRAELRRVSGLELGDTEIDQAWNAMLLDLPLARMAYIKQVAARHRVFLLSNTNEIHKKAFDEIARAALQGPSFNSYFEKAYYSHELGLRKPDPAIFKYLIEENGLNPAKTLFIDDLIANIEGAKSVGLQTFHLREDLLSPSLQFLVEGTKGF